MAITQTSYLRRIPWGAGTQTGNASWQGTPSTTGNLQVVWFMGVCATQTLDVNNMFANPETWTAFNDGEGSIVDVDGTTLQYGFYWRYEPAGGTNMEWVFPTATASDKAIGGGFELSVTASDNLMRNPGLTISASTTRVQDCPPPPDLKAKTGVAFYGSMAHEDRFISGTTRPAGWTSDSFNPQGVNSQNKAFYWKELTQPEVLSGTTDDFSSGPYAHVAFYLAGWKQSGRSRVAKEAKHMTSRRNRF